MPSSSRPDIDEEGDSCCSVFTGSVAVGWTVPWKLSIGTKLNCSGSSSETSSWYERAGTSWCFFDRRFSISAISASAASFAACFFASLASARAFCRSSFAACFCACLAGSPSNNSWSLSPIACRPSSNWYPWRLLNRIAPPTNSRNATK